MAEQRDYVMARLAAARGALAAAEEVLDGCILFFIAPDEDKNGAERKESLEELLDIAGDISRSIELAQEGMEALSKADLKEGEPEHPEESDDAAAEA